MKNNDVNDPLKEKEFNEQQPETQNKEPLEEEKKNNKDQTQQNQAAQEINPQSPEGNTVAESSPTPKSEPASESPPESTQEPPQESTQEATQELPQEPPQEAAQEPVQKPPKEAAQEPSQEPPQEAVQEPPQESTQEATQELPQEPPQEAAQEPVQEPPQEAVQELPQEPPQESTQEATQELPQEPPQEAAQEPVQKPIQETSSKPASVDPATESDKEISAETESKPEPEKPKTSEKTEQPASTKKNDTAKTSDDDQLIDDHEEKLKNDIYDGAVDHEDHEKSQERERTNYSLLSKEDLVKMMRDKLDNPGKGNIRKEVEEIKHAFYEKINATLEEKKKHFLEEGGDLEDFKPADEPSEAEMKELLYKYRGLKAEFTKQLEKTKQENLLKKQEILEQLRILMEGQESFELTFRKFKDLQKKWFSVGVVPQQNLKDLWDSYNYFVDKFNDYVRINRDLRALDLKKNLELKIQLCERTEELDNEPNIVQAFKILQKHHTRWREIGPVPREHRDEVWDRFKLATSLINKKHQEYHSRLKESLYENLDRKTELCEKVESIAATVYESHGAWVEKTNVVLEIQKNWKTIGYAPKKDNNAIYARFRKACDIFFGNKAKFYAAAYEEQKENLTLKLKITERAEALRTSEDWKETTNELIRLQKQWKEIGPVPRRDSDKLWRRFRASCDTFFNNKSKYFENIDSTFEDNLKEKEALVNEINAYTPQDDKKKDLEALESFQSKFDAIGYVPSGKKDWIKEQFRLAQDNLLEGIGMNESERSLYKFRNRVKSMTSAPRSEMKLNFERDKLVNKLQQLKNDIGVWENNIGFFKQSDSSEETIQGFHGKIEAAHERIRVLEQKIRILDDVDNAN